MASTSNVTHSLMFHEFSTLCENISSARRDKKSDILQKFISNFRTNSTESFYTVLRLLLPALDRERAAYGIKETALARIYVRVLCLNPNSADALKLKNFRAPKNAGDSAGDFGDVAYWVLRSRCSEGKELTLNDVHTHLDTIALRHAEKKPREVDRELEVMLRRMSAQEQKWLIRVVLKDMRLGLGQNRILSLYHPDARELYDFTNSLQQVCDKLSSPSRRLHEVEVTLFTPCRPMLAERCDVQDIDRHFARRPGPRYVETKLDGERSQLHYCDGKFKFFSRNAYDFTDSFGSDETSGSLAPYLAKQLKPGVRNCILDGEMMPWNTKYQHFGTKAMNLDVKSLRVGTVHQPCFCVFDVLLFNDVVLTNRPLRDRLSALDHIFTPCPGIMMEPWRQTVHYCDEVLAVLNTAIDNREEGIVVKEPDSVYKPNSRKEGWIKIKPEYTPGAMVELDLVIMGGYYGEGRRRGVVSHFLLAVAQPPPTSDGVPLVFESMVRVGSGCTMDELADLSRKLEPHWQRVRTGHQPPGLLWTRERPDLWIEPCNSVILQVKASEVVRSDMYQTGYTLRFPRIEKVRYDKPWTDCLTTVEFINLRQSGSGSLVGAHISQRVTSPAGRKRRAAPTLFAAPHCRNPRLDQVTVVSSLFAGREICVLTGLPDLTREQMEYSIEENGGLTVVNPGKNTYCVVVGAETSLRVQNVCKAGVYDVVRAGWLVRCLDAGELLAWSPADMVSAAPHTAAWLDRQYDRYGDSYTRPATLDSLRHSLALVDSKEISLEQMSELDKLLFGGFSPFSIFRGCVAYFDCFEEIENELLPLKTPLSHLRFDFQFHGGQITTDINKQTTHIVLHSSDLERLEGLIERVERAGGGPAVVQHYWLEDCLAAGTRLQEDQHRLH